MTKPATADEKDSRNRWRDADGTLSVEGWSQIFAAMMRGSLIEGKTGGQAALDECLAAGMHPDAAIDATNALVSVFSAMRRGTHERHRK
jgi:hypothetical protein